MRLEQRFKPRSHSHIVAADVGDKRAPLIDRFETDITAAIKSGDRLLVDPAQGLVEILR